MTAIKAEEKQYPKDLPIIYDFGTEEEKERLLTLHYEKIFDDINEMCNEIMNAR